MKYMGSKRSLVKEILPIILKDRKTNQWYVEPFAGGMNVIHNVNGNRIANDNHYHLIKLWEALVNGYKPKEYYTKEEYLHIKNNMDMYPPHEVGWVGFACSYCGIWCAGFSGEFHCSKTGRKRNYQTETIGSITKQLKNMDGVIFQNKTYSEIELPPNSIIYCDPPYEGTTQYNTGIFDHTKFWDWCREKTLEGHSVFISEYNAPEDFEIIWEKSNVKSNLSNNGRTGGWKLSTEKLFKMKNPG